MSDNQPEGEAPKVEEEKKKRGRPKDEHAPPKPKNPYSHFAGEARTKLKETNPELVADLSAMGKAIADKWAEVAESEKTRLQEIYEKEMEVWRPLWEEYKKTRHYKDFVEVKTDYLDKKAQKKLVKTMNKDAPKRPKSGYMIFAGQIREGVMEKIKAEGLGLGDAGRIISERWAALSEGQKGEYAEQSQKEKIAFDQADGVYKQTEAFGTFCDAKAKLESQQQLKKLTRTCLDEAPKQAPSPYALFRSEVMPGIVKENSEKKEGEGKLSMGEMGKKIADMWAKVSDEKKAGYTATSEKLKAEREVAYKEFKSNQKYTEYLEKKQKVKTRENNLVHLREMPKKPKSVFALFAHKHKNEVKAGRGEGEGNKALKQKFEHASVEEKKDLAAENEKLTAEWNAKVVEYKAGVKYKTYEATKNKIAEEFKNEAIKVTTMKFLSDAPEAPPKSAFSVFVGEKRKANAAAPGEKQSKEAKRAEVVKAQEEWGKLTETFKEAYETKRQEMTKAYEAEIKTFMAGEKWQDYQKEAKRLRIPIKSLMFHKKKVMQAQKLKDGKPNPASVDLPSKPDIFPAKPLSAVQLFTAEKKKTVEQVSQISEMWSKLTAEDKAVWDGKAAEQVTKHEADMEAFRKSATGSKYFRDVAIVQKRRRLIIAKNKYLDDLPKKPMAAVYSWMQNNLKKVRKEFPEAKGFELKKTLGERWAAMPAEEKEPLEKAAKEKEQEYETKMAEFKASDNWKNFVRATTVRRKFKAKQKVKAKGKGKAAPAGPVAPASMPKRPVNAFMAFMKSESSAGRSGAMAECQKKFNGLSEDEKKKLLAEADERTAKYREEMAAFEKSAEGRRFKFQTLSFAKRKKMTDLRSKYMKDEPKRPQGAYFIFVNANRAKVAKENPDLKGIGPIGQKLGQMWKELQDKSEYEDKAKEEQAAYEKRYAEFQATDDYKKYKRLSNIVQGVSKPKAKVKKGPLVVQPVKPAGMPVAPKSGFGLFGQEQQQKGQGGLKEVAKAWTDLMAEGQKPYQDKAEELKQKFEADMKVFQNTVEGKKYIREKGVADRKSKLVMAKKRFLGGDSAPKEPKRPASSYFLFLGEQSKLVSSENRSEKAKDLTAKWNSLTPEEKAKYENQAKELKDEYEVKMKEYKNTAGYKNYARTMNQVTGKAAKEKARKMAKIAAMQRQKEQAAKKAAKLAKTAARTAPTSAASPAVKSAAPAATKPKAAGDGDSDEMGSDSSAKSSSSSSSSDSD